MRRCSHGAVRRWERGIPASNAPQGRGYIICKAHSAFAEHVLFAADIRFGQWRGDFYLSDFAIGLSEGFEFYLLHGVCACAEKHDRGQVAINFNVVPAVVEILCRDCRAFPAIREFLWG